ncbi:MAG: hypothetical protein WBQ45_04830 [Roseiarcus sp.]
MTRRVRLADSPQQGAANVACYLACRVMLAAAASSVALAKTEKEFVRDAIMGDNSEALGQLAAGPLRVPPR